MKEENGRKEMREEQVEGAQGEREAARKSLSPENQRVVPVEPLLAEPHPLAALAQPSPEPCPCQFGNCMGADTEQQCKAQPSPAPELVHCACGDAFPVNSYGAGFMDANNGVCQNCDAANSATKALELERPEVVATVKTMGFGRLYAEGFGEPIDKLKAGDELMAVAQHERILRQALGARDDQSE